MPTQRSLHASPEGDRAGVLRHRDGPALTAQRPAGPAVPPGPSTPAATPVVASSTSFYPGEAQPGLCSTWKSHRARAASAARRSATIYFLGPAQIRRLVYLKIGTSTYRYRTHVYILGVLLYRDISSASCRHGAVDFRGWALAAHCRGGLLHDSPAALLLALAAGWARRPVPRHQGE
eukprot:COSAG06_NODE_13647_length_1235_cov_2.011444_1_plen_176_part_10